MQWEYRSCAEATEVMGAPMKSARPLGVRGIFGPIELVDRYQVCARDAIVGDREALHFSRPGGWRAAGKEGRVVEEVVRRYGVEHGPRARPIAVGVESSGTGKA